MYFFANETILFPEDKFEVFVDLLLLLFVFTLDFVLLVDDVVLLLFVLSFLSLEELLLVTSATGLSDTKDFDIYPVILLYFIL